MLGFDIRCAYAGIKKPRSGTARHWALQGFFQCGEVGNGFLAEDVEEELG